MSSTMYSTKQIIRHDMPIEVSNCMYKMKNLLSAGSCTVHVSSAENKCDILEQVNKFLKVSLNINSIHICFV